jgi:hypothetical protein
MSLSTRDDILRGVERKEGVECAMIVVVMKDGVRLNEVVAVGV